MKRIARLAVLGAASVAAIPSASASTLIYGHINTGGAANYNDPLDMFTVSSTGAASLDLVTSGSPAGSTTGYISGPPATGTLSAFYPSGIVTDYSFSTSTISAATPTEILSISDGTDTEEFFATSTGAFIPTDLPTTEGDLILYGYLTDVGPNYSTNDTAELDIAANGIGNNFTADLTAITPEPSSLLLLGSGLILTGSTVFRRRRA